LIYKLTNIGFFGGTTPLQLTTQDVPSPLPVNGTHIIGQWAIAPDWVTANSTYTYYSALPNNGGKYRSLMI